VDLKGEPLPRAPEFSANLAADYRWPIGANEAFIRAEYIYKDSQFSTIEDVTYLQTSNALVLLDPTAPAEGANVVGQIPDRSDGFPFKTPTTNLFHLRGGYMIGDSWEIAGFVENVFDEDYYTGAGDNFGLAGIRLKPHPRTIGMTVSFRFGGGESRAATPAASSAPLPPPAPPPNPDLDGDGVPNEKDKCPNTRPGAVVDLDGCEVEAVIALEGVHFDFDKSTLRPEAIVILNEAAGLLKSQATVVVEIAGHTDSIGTEEYNQGLSERRAQAVKDYLESQGITATRLTARGYGETQPIASNDTEDGRALNRRVEMIVLSR
jgi:outer membrane protein OmpA-like peptidoglycan-associated protein